MIKYFNPLWVFILGMVGTLVLTIFFPAIGTAQTQLEADTADIAANFWGWTEVVTSTRLIIFISCFASTLIITATVWLKRKG